MRRDGTQSSRNLRTAQHTKKSQKPSAHTVSRLVVAASTPSLFASCFINTRIAHQGKKRGPPRNAKWLPKSHSLVWWVWRVRCVAAAAAAVDEQPTKPAGMCVVHEEESQVLQDYPLQQLHPQVSLKKKKKACALSPRALAWQTGWPPQSSLGARAGSAKAGHHHIRLKESTM